MCTYAWPFEHDLALWNDCGVRHAGLISAKLADDPERKMQQLTDHGICASTMITGCFDLSDRASWGKTREAQRSAIDWVAGQAGHSIYFTPGRTTGAIWRDDVATLAEAVAPIVAYGRDKGVRVAIEPSLRTSVSFINTLRDATDTAEQTGLHLISDFGNMWMERDFRETLARAMPHIALMQINDIVIGTTTKPPPGGRAHIGDGELPLHRMMQDVLDAGYTGVFDLEVIGANLAVDDYDEAALRRGIEAASLLLDEMGI